MGMADLRLLVGEAGGPERIAAYLETDQHLIADALEAPDGAWTDRVAAMVHENTSKLIGMPAQGGFFWRLTRRRVVKDWLLLARWSQTRH